MEDIDVCDELAPENNRESDLSNNDKNEIIERKIYPLNFKKLKYNLIIEYKADKRIYFYIIQDDDSIDEYYKTNYDIITIKNIYDLEETYNNEKKIFAFFVDLLDRNKIIIEKEGKEIKLAFQREGKEFGDSYYHICFKKYRMKRDLIMEIFPELNKDSNNNKSKKNKDIKKDNLNELNKKKSGVKKAGNNVNEIKLESIDDNNIEDNEFDDDEGKINLPEKAEAMKFTEGPEALRFDYPLTKDISSYADELNNFDVFIGVRDHVYYVIYNNTRNYNIEIMNIFNRKIVKSLSGHQAKTSVIKYYLHSVKTEYILSCDTNSKAMIWDVADDFSIKYILRMSDIGRIKDAILLFGIQNKNYLIISRHNNEEFTKLYELSKDTPYVRKIMKSNKNVTYKLIPWKYKDKYYLIELCKGFINIKNIFEDENYARFKMEKGDDFTYISGYITIDNQLVVNNSYNKTIVFLDLIEKAEIKTINYSHPAYSLISWNDKYALLIGTYIEFIDLENKKISDKKISYQNTLYGAKKIKNQLLGEALITSDDKQNLVLFSLFNK